MRDIYIQYCLLPVDLQGYRMLNGKKNVCIFRTWNLSSLKSIYYKASEPTDIGNDLRNRSWVRTQVDENFVKFRVYHHSSQNVIGRKSVAQTPDHQSSIGVLTSTVEVR